MVFTHSKRSRITLVSILLLYAAIAPAATRQYDFKLYKLQGEQAGPTLLIIGGIQGDEPGGFTAASLIATNYQIKKGNVWVVPNLNFASILQSSRGLHGDMNRKFLHIDEDDPDYHVVSQIKKLIIDQHVDLILNLHDGSGFFNPAYIDQERNPYRWGQSVIIDQEEIKAEKFTRLGDISRQVIMKANSQLPQRGRYFVKNTRTREGDTEMEKSLTFFAVRHGKSAFGIEASKSFSTYDRAYYHLHVIESFMNVLGLEFKRDFELNREDIHQAMYKSIDLRLYDHKFYLPGNDLKKAIYYVPMSKDGRVEFKSANPLVALLHIGDHYKIKYGNRNLSSLYPQYFSFDDSLQSVALVVDGKKLQATLGNIISVQQWVLVRDLPEYRVNVIGARIAGRRNEVETEIRKAMLPYRFSIDKAGKIFRVEFYRNKSYCGMLLIQFP